MPDERDGPVLVASEEDAEGLEVDGAEDEERPEHEEVGGARHRPLEQLALREDLDDLGPDRLAQPLGDVLEPVGGGLAAGDRDGTGRTPGDRRPGARRPASAARRSAPTGPRSLLARFADRVGRAAASLVRRRPHPSLLSGNFGPTVGTTWDVARRYDPDRCFTCGSRSYADLARAGSWPARHGARATRTSATKGRSPWVRRLASRPERSASRPLALAGLLGLTGLAALTGSVRVRRLWRRFACARPRAGGAAGEGDEDWTLMIYDVADTSNIANDMIANLAAFAALPGDGERQRRGDGGPARADRPGLPAARRCRASRRSPRPSSSCSRAAAGTRSATSARSRWAARTPWRRFIERGRRRRSRPRSTAWSSPTTAAPGPAATSTPDRPRPRS